MKENPQTAGKPVLSLWFSLGLNEGDPLVSVDVGIPGREGSFVRTWGVVGRSLTEAEHQDLQSFVLVTIRHTYLARYGIQSVLHMG